MKYRVKDAMALYLPQMSSTRGRHRPSGKPLTGDTGFAKRRIRRIARRALARDALEQVVETANDAVMANDAETVAPIAYANCGRRTANGAVCWR